MTVHIAAISYGSLFAFYSGNSVEIFIFITITTTINVIPIAPLSRYAFHSSDDSPCDTRTLKSYVTTL